MGRVACSAAAALRAHPATTSLETAAVLLDSQAMAANRVSAAGTTSASTAFLSIWTMSIFLWTHSCIYKNTPQDTFMMNQKAGTSLTNGTCELPPSLPPSACLPGTFGQNCNRVCQCSQTNQLCHPVSGSCYCAPGFHGPKCDQSMYSIMFIPLRHDTSHLKVLNLVFICSLWRGSLRSELWTRVSLWQRREVRSFHRSLWMSGRFYRSTLQHQWVWNHNAINL